MTALLRGLGVVAVVVASLAVLGCGHRGPPRPPLPRIPRMPIEVAWIQRGDQLLVTGQVLGQSLAGRRLEPPLRPVLFFFSAPDRQLAAGWDTPSRDREFLRMAVRIELAPLDPPADTQRLEFERHVPISRLGQGEAVVLALGLADRRSVSLPSRRRVLLPAREPLRPLEDVAVEPQRDGVRLSWRRPADPRVRRVHVYRGVDGPAGGYRAWKKVDAAAGSVIDREARYGQTLSYALAAAAGEGEIAVESELVRPEPLEYRDTFAPAEVRDVDAVAERGGIRVLWFPGGAEDEVRARIERQEEGEATWVLVGTVEMPDTDFEDRSTLPGHRYRYRVIALDASGNAAPPAGPTRYVTPREEDGGPR